MTFEDAVQTYEGLRPLVSKRDAAVRRAIYEGFAPYAVGALIQSQKSGPSTDVLETALRDWFVDCVETNMQKIERPRGAMPGQVDMEEFLRDHPAKGHTS